MSSIGSKSKQYWIVFIIGIAETIAAGTTFYSLAQLKQRIAMDTGWSSQTIVLGFTLAVLMWSLAAKPVGHLLYKYGGRVVLASGLVISGLLLASIALASNEIVWLVLWFFLGLAFAMTFYEAAFATIVEIFGEERAKVINPIITIIGSLSSTLSWLTGEYVLGDLGWRQILLVYATVNVLAALVIWLSLPGYSRRHVDGGLDAKINCLLPYGMPFLLLVFVFATSNFFMGAISVHIIDFFVRLNLERSEAIRAASFIGISLSVARTFGWLRIVPLSKSKVGVAFWSIALLLVALLILAFGGGAVAIVFAVAYGLSQGFFALARATLQLNLFGSQNFPIVQSRIVRVGLFVQAIAPYLFEMMLEALSVQIIFGLLIGLAILSLGAVLSLARYASRSAT